MIILGTSGQPVTTITPGQMPGHDHGNDHGPEPGHGTGGTDMPGMDHGGPSTSPSGQHHQGDSVTSGALTSGAPLAATASPHPAATKSPAAASVRVLVIAGGRRVGTVLIDFPAASQTAAGQARDAIVRAVGAGALLAVLLAAVVALSCPGAPPGRWPPRPARWNAATRTRPRCCVPARSGDPSSSAD